MTNESEAKWGISDVMRWLNVRERVAREVVATVGLDLALEGSWRSGDFLEWFDRQPYGVEILPRETCLYRHFAKDGSLLYVGIALSPIHRLQTHRKLSPWFKEIARIEIEWFKTDEEAIAAERAAIKSERPKYNKVHAPR